MRSLICLFVLLALGATTADAQRRRDRHHSRERVRCCRTPVEFGVRAGYDFGDHVGLAGAQLRVPFVKQLFLLPSADVFFEGDDDFAAETQWQVNADVAAAPRELGGLYLGAGAAFVRRDFNADGDNEVEVGYNLFGGLQGRSLFDARVRPFVEARWTDVRDYDPFRLVLGINVPVR